MIQDTKRKWSKGSILQAALVGVLVFGDIGFDHPGRFGLAFGTLIICGLALTLSSLIGTYRNARRAAWSAALVQFSLPFVAFAGMLVMESWYSSLN